MTDIVEEIESALTGITPGKWEYNQFSEDITAPNNVVVASCDHLTSTDRNGFFVAASPDLLQRAKNEIVRLREWLKLIEAKGHIIEEGYPSFWSTQALGGKSVADIEP